MTCRRNDRCEQEKRIEALIFGTTLIGLGSFAWLTKASVAEIVGFWPLILIGIGASKLISDPRHRDGSVVFIIGLVFLLDHLDVFNLWNSWPLLLIAAGVHNVVTSFGIERSRSSLEAGDNV